MISRANQQLPLTDVALGSTGEVEDLGMDQEYIAAEMFRRLEEANPLITDSEEAMDYVVRTISAKVQGHNLDGFREEAERRDEGVALLNAGAQLLESFKQYGGLDTLQEAVDMLRRALALFPQGQHHRGSALNNLATALVTQYEQDSDILKLSEAVDRHREALSLRPQGHPDRAISLHNLVDAVMNQYDQDGDTAKLAEMVDWSREALSLCPEGHPDRSKMLSKLASALRASYQQDGDISKLVEAISWHREALYLSPQGHPGRPISFNNLATALMRQYEQDGDPKKLVETVDLHRKALSLRPEGHPDRVSSLINLAVTLMWQYKQDGNMSKLIEAVDCQRDALLLSPQGHHDRAVLLDNLAGALTMQYEKDGDVSKLAEAVDWRHEALSLRPRGHPDRGDSLNNLSNNYLAQHEHDGNESALITALELRRECLDSWIPGHPVRHEAHHSIAEVQLMDSSLFDWTKALDHLMQAITDNSATPRLRLIRGIQSLRRVERASARNPKQYFYSQQVLVVYIQAIQLLPRAAHAGLDISVRLRELAGSEQLCRVAAMRAMLLGQLPTAVEVFEEGKAVFWSQALRLRSTALDKLPTADGDRLRHLFRMLDADHTGSSVVGLERADLEQHIEHRRQLNNKADRLIEEIRHRPGFERFLRNPQYEQLAEVASNGYVVALIANEPVYFAILIQAGKDPQPVSLPSVDGKTLRRLTELTSGSGMRDLADERVTKQRIHPRVPLEQIWVTIVKPVLLHLGLQVCHNRLIS
jgi:tetratricopeptide (TPR) repeat protein